MAKKGDYERYKSYYDEYRKKNAKKIAEKRRLRLENKEPNKKCKVCKKNFFSYDSLSKFCSRTCFDEDMKKSRTGKSNPAYRNGMYCRGAKQDRKKGGVHDHRGFDPIRKVVKNDIIKKYGYLCCEYCGATNSLSFELHHIIFRSEAPNHKNLHHRKNALYLCVRCHNIFHKHKFTRDQIVKERKLYELFPEYPKLRPAKKI